MSKIKILQLVEDLKLGGLERVIAAIAYGLDEKKYDLEVWCISKGGEVAEELKRNNIRVKILGISTYHNPLNIFKLVAYLRKEKFSIVHTHGYFASVIGRISAKMVNIPIVVNHVHSVYREYKKRHLFIEKILSLFTDKIICCSEAVKDFVVNYEKIKLQKVSMIYNGLDLNRFSKSRDSAVLREELGIENKDSVIGEVASLVLNKGHQYFIDAAGEILASFPNTKFLIIGDGPLKRDLIQQADKLNITSKVIFTGIRNDIPDLLSVIDIFVLSSLRREGLTIAMIEAMASSKPIVSTNVGGLPEMVKDGVNGILVSPGSSRKLATAVGSLLKNRQKLEKMGQESRKIYEDKFTFEKFISKIEELYNSLILAKKLR